MNGKKLKNLRENQGLLQKELAREMGISLSSISMYERGERQPDNETLKKFSQYFNVSIDYLLDNNITVNKEIIELEVLQNLLIKNGYMKEGEDLTKKELDNLMKMAKNNKEFLKGD